MKILLWWSYYFYTVVTCLFLVQGLELRWQICRVYGTKISNHHGSMFSVTPSPFIISIALYVVHYLSHRSQSTLSFCTHTRACVPFVQWISSRSCVDILCKISRSYQLLVCTENQENAGSPKFQMNSSSVESNNILYALCSNSMRRLQ